MKGVPCSVQILSCRMLPEKIDSISILQLDTNSFQQYSFFIIMALSDPDLIYIDPSNKKSEHWLHKLMPKDLYSKSII